jgi:hypothetical protein
MHQYVEHTWGTRNFSKSILHPTPAVAAFQIIAVGSTAVGAARVLDTPSGIDREFIVIDPPFAHGNWI